MLTSTDLCERAGVTYRSLDYWVRPGALVPSVEADGSGSQRLFEDEALGQVVIIKRLRRLGISLQVIKELGVEDAPGELIRRLLDLEIEVASLEIEVPL